VVVVVEGVMAVLEAVVRDPVGTLKHLHKSVKAWVVDDSRLFLPL
jgi:hypothetical protein